MQFISRESGLILLFAAFTVALIYYVAFDHILTTGQGVVSTILGKVMGQDSSGNFQKPF